MNFMYFVLPVVETAVESALGVPSWTPELRYSLRVLYFLNKLGLSEFSKVMPAMLTRASGMMGCQACIPGWVRAYC